MALSESQKRANKKYYQNNKEKENLQSYYRISKLYIRKSEEIEKLEELNQMIVKKIEKLETENKSPK